MTVARTETTRVRLLEIAGYVGIVVLAAALRLPNLAVRGTWDADQGHDMLVLRAFVLDGQIPLLGPPTSIGAFHHGMLYYVLLAPAAFVSRADPTAVTAWIALGGVAAVAVTGWLARSIAGRVAGLIAALLLAVSASAVEESIFIWNPNLIALTSSVALAAAWHAWRSRRAGWWVLAGIGAVATGQCHVLGVILTPVIAALLVADVRRRRSGDNPAGARSVVLAAGMWALIAVASYVPLAIHELGNDFSELRAAAAFLVGGGGQASIALPLRLPIVAVRVLAWPLTGLITSAPAAAVMVAALVVLVAVWRGWLDGARVTDRERAAIRWLALGLAWTIVALAAGAASLATVVVGLPNDHYHAFADPIVVVIVAVGLAALWRRLVDGRGRSLEPSAVASSGVAVLLMIALVAFNLATQPPARAADGGWEAAQAAATRVVHSAGDGPVKVISLPPFKSDEAIRMPLEAIGADVTRVGSSSTAAATAVICDQLFNEAIGADCGGPAEDALVKSLPLATEPTLRDRFEAAPGRWISVYSR